jgi:hypothetical protein
MASFVNHNQTLANVRLQWSQKGNHMQHFMDADVRILDKDWRAKLAMEMVALRDIQPDEEIFLDYGDAWEAAWQYHLQTWEPEPNAADYVSAADLNQNKVSWRTEFDLLDAGYTDEYRDTEVWCNDAFIDEKWRGFYKQGRMSEFFSQHQGHIYNCDLLSHETLRNGTTLYTAFLWWKDKVTGETVSIGMIRDVPQVALIWYDLPYQSDVQMYNTFRHDLRIPDDMFPKAWKNRLEEENDDVEEGAKS